MLRQALRLTGFESSNERGYTCAPETQTMAKKLKTTVLSTDGTIEKLQSGGFVVRLQGSRADLLANPGVSCENPEAPEGERIYRKEFRTKKIYLPGEEAKARDEVLGGPDRIVIGMTGYSSIGAANEKAWGVPQARYVAACADVLGTMIHKIQKEFPGVRVMLADGASDLGVDRAMLEVAGRMNLNHLGHSCPRFMFYVKDDATAVLVSASQKAYSDAFIESLQIIISCGGRMQALEHDITAAIVKDRRLIVVNVIEAIAPHGGPPARDGDGKVQDASAAFQQCVFTASSPVPLPDSAGYEGVREHAASIGVHCARSFLSADRAFGSWTRTA